LEREKERCTNYGRNGFRSM